MGQASVDLAALAARVLEVLDRVGPLTQPAIQLELAMTSPYWMGKALDALLDGGLIVAAVEELTGEFQMPNDRGKTQRRYKARVYRCVPGKKPKAARATSPRVAVAPPPDRRASRASAKAEALAPEIVDALRRFGPLPLAGIQQVLGLTTAAYLTKALGALLEEGKVASNVGEIVHKQRRAYGRGWREQRYRAKVYGLAPGEATRRAKK